MSNKVTDTIIKTEIKQIPKTVFVEKIKTVKGKDSIIYVGIPTDSTIAANQYDVKLKSDNSEANLKITTTGELLDVQGTIYFVQKNKVKEVEIHKDKSGLFLYAETSLNNLINRAEIGLDYQIKNKTIIGTSVGYDNYSENVNFNVKLGFRIF